VKSIFISRSLSLSSPIRQVIGNHTLVDQSLIQFASLDFETPQADWIFFYSRNGVKYFFEKGNFELYPYLWACMSEGTADELSHYVNDISFIGTGQPEEVAQSYQNIVSPEQVTCYIRAEKSMDSIHKYLNKEEDFSIPVYNNSPTDHIPEQDFEILIFTSPMNADAWFAKREYKNEKVISIGKTTADHLTDSYKIRDIIIAKNPSEDSIAECLRSIL